MSKAFVFPGQGAQVIGMGRALAEAYPAARAVFDEVDAALGEKLSALIWEGEQDALTLTQNAQPALMATSIAAMRALDRVSSARHRCCFRLAAGPKPCSISTPGWSRPMPMPPVRGRAAAWDWAAPTPATRKLAVSGRFSVWAEASVGMASAAAVRAAQMNGVRIRIMRLLVDQRTGTATAAVRCKYG